jgi:hypothetical protein
LLKWRVVETAQSSGRRDLALRVAQHLLETTRRKQEDLPRVATIVAATASERDATATMEAFDRRAREEPSSDAAVAAVAAVAGWTAMGITSRADALLGLWRPRGLVWPSNHTCGLDWSLCHDATVVQMLRRANRLSEGFDGLHLTAETAIANDLSDGRGLTRLPEFLAREQTAQSRESALGGCVKWAIENNQLETATSCARQLRASVSSRTMSYEERARAVSLGDSIAASSGPYGAAQRSLDVAAAAAQVGQTELAREMINNALEFWASVPPVRWSPLNNTWTTRVGAALLREQGRL